MGKQQSTPRPSRRGRWRWAAFGALAVIAAGVSALWWSGGSPDAAGQARLVVDRTADNNPRKRAPGFGRVQASC